MKLLLLPIGCILLAGCVSTESECHVRESKQKRSMIMQEESVDKCATVSKEINVKQYKNTKKSTQGTFCGDKNVSDDF